MCNIRCQCFCFSLYLFLFMFQSKRGTNLLSPHLILTNFFSPSRPPSLALQSAQTTISHNAHTCSVGSNLVPDDCGALMNTHMANHLATNSDLVLYEAKHDHGYAFQCYRLIYACLLTPVGWVYIASNGKVID